MESSYVSPSNFSEVLESRHCKHIQETKLADTSILSFSISTEPSNIFRVGTVAVTQIFGYITSAQQKWLTAVQEWLTHPDIFNLELTPIANRHAHETIKKFLDESALAVASAADDSASGAAQVPPQPSDGRRLRVDLGKDSAAPRVRKAGPGRPRKQNPALPEHPTPHADGATPWPPPALRLRVQYRASGANSRATDAAAAGAARMLASLGRRLCLIWRWMEEDCAVELMAVLETASTATEVRAAAIGAGTRAAGRGGMVGCYVTEDPDRPKDFGKALQRMVGSAGWRMWAESADGPGSAPPPAAPAAAAGAAGGAGAFPSQPTAPARAPTRLLVKYVAVVAPTSQRPLRRLSGAHSCWPRSAFAFALSGARKSGTSGSARCSSTR